VSSCPALLQESGWRLILPEVRLRLDAQHDNWKRQSHPADQQARKRGRSKYFPVAPTLAEQGYPEATVTPWFGFVIPAKTPQPVLDKISKALDTALADADVQKKLDTAGCEPAAAPLKAFDSIIARDVDIWTKVIKDANITAD
jgi:tripartite-type tricarboxylate transporter receptor subunit TctC